MNVASFIKIFAVVAWVVFFGLRARSYYAPRAAKMSREL